MTTRTKNVLIASGVLVWFCGIVVAMLAIWQYKSTPGERPMAPETWPVASAIHPTPGVANVVLFAHPQCPCTKASMTELARLADELGPDAKIHVVLVRPDGTEAGFEDGVIADRAAAIQHSDVVVDVGGVESARFGAIVSGSTVVYAADGKLVFRGGLTVARGHEGHGPAHDRIIALVHQTTHGARVEAPTFGCAIERPELAVHTQ